MYSQIALSSSTTMTRTGANGLDMGRPSVISHPARKAGSEGGLVGARGFEPPTSRSRTVRATRLRYAPWCVQAGRNLDGASVAVKHDPSHNLVHVRERRCFSEPGTDAEKAIVVRS